MKVAAAFFVGGLAGMGCACIAPGCAWAPIFGVICGAAYLAVTERRR